MGCPIFCKYEGTHPSDFICASINVQLRHVYLLKLRGFNVSLITKVFLLFFICLHFYNRPIHTQIPCSYTVESCQSQFVNFFNLLICIRVLNFCLHFLFAYILLILSSLNFFGFGFYRYWNKTILFQHLLTHQSHLLLNELCLKITNSTSLYFK